MCRHAQTELYIDNKVILTKKEGMTALRSYGQDPAETLDLFTECRRVSGEATDTDWVQRRHLHQKASVEKQATWVDAEAV